MTQDQQPKIGIARIYIKDLSFESPAAPNIFSQQLEPEVGLRVSVEHRGLQEQLFEVVLQLTIEARQKGEIAFIVEVEQAGIFEIRDASDQQRVNILNIFCPATLFPYARQAVDAALGQGGFPPLMLAPLNFEALYRQKQQGEAAPSHA